jgi:hypothetical protein
MKLDPHRIGARAILLPAALLLLSIGEPQAQNETGSAALIPADRFELPDPAFRAIAQCLSAGNEIVLAPELHCVPYEAGHKELEGQDIQLKTDVEPICRDAHHPRRLPANVVKRLAAQKETPIAPSGIRILGAVFCEDLDLVGLDIPYSLVLDSSIFARSIDSRNFRTKNDLSFDYSVILGSLVLTRARVEGSIYESASFVNKLVVSDAEVSGTWWLRNSILLKNASLRGVSIAGDLTLNGSAFSWLWLQSSRIGRALELNNTEARCAYHIKASNIGYVMADKAGFGIVKTSSPTEEHPAVDYAWWNRAVPPSSNKPSANVFVRLLFDSPIIKSKVREMESAIPPQIDNAPPTTSPAIYGCQTDGNALPAAELEFLVADTTIRTALCFTSFEWAAPKGTIPDASHPASIVALRETTVDGSLIVHIWDDEIEKRHDALQANQTARSIAKMKNRFEAVGLTAGVFIFNFSEGPKPYAEYLDGLSFSRIENDPHPACDSAGELLGKANLASRGNLPDVGSVMRWLDANEARSSQPFAVFVQAFERAGLDATDLRVNRATLDLRERTNQRLMRSSTATDSSTTSTGKAASQSTQADRGWAGASVLGGALVIFSAVADLIGIVFQWMMWAIADHGLRPAKAVWWVLAVLLSFWIWFWFKLKIVGFEPKAKGESPQSAEKAKGAANRQVAALPKAPEPWPISFLFLFDRLIPVYQIREEHYSIDKVYRRSSPGETAKAKGAIAANSADAKAKSAVRPSPCTMRYMGIRTSVWPADDKDRERFEKWLVVLRVIGIGLSGFLLAAVNALISR